MAQFTSRDIDYFHGETRMIGRFCAPSVEAGGNLPGVLAVHGAHGLGGHVIACAERIAQLGYGVLAVDLWGERKLIADPAEIGATLGRFAGDRDMWMGRMEAARIALAAQPGVDGNRVGAVGYCFGGASVLEMARSGGGLSCAVSLHGGLDVVGDDWSAAMPDVRLLICTGAEDPLAGQPDLVRLQRGMSTAGLGWEVDLYGHARHAFTEPDRPGAPPFAGYNAQADRRSWAAMRQFFEDALAS